MKTIIWAFLISTWTFCPLPGFSQSPLIGTQAPPIDIEAWIYPKIQVAGWQNKKVPEDLHGKIIVLDFWFTSCAPCVAAIPDLNHLARQFPEVVFLSVTFDEPDKIDKFLDKMIMYYPVGSDPKRKTIGAFGVSGFPETFLIDENGIIIWRGSPFDLDSKMINEVLGRETALQRPTLNNSERLSENSAYSFSLKEHDLEMGSASYSHVNPFEINAFNQDLESMLEAFYGINTARILTRDSALLKARYDLTLKADEAVSTKANCVEMLKYLLPQHLEFTLKEIEKDTVVNVLRVENDALLTTHKSDYQYLGVTMRHDNWEAKGATIENLKDFLENNFSKLIEVNAADTRKFDFILPAKDFADTQKTLEDDYGLTLKAESQRAVLWEILREKGE